MIIIRATFKATCLFLILVLASIIGFQDSYAGSFNVSKISTNQRYAINVAILTAHVINGLNAVSTIDPANNSYSTDGVLVIQGINGASLTQNRTQCAPFVTRLLTLTYDLSPSYFKSWSNSASPNAAKYFDAINAGSSFTKISKIQDIKPGDILAVKYIQGDGTGATGHTMIAVMKPKAIAATAPFVSGTTQYEALVLDSSSTPHGSDDSRVGTSGQGAGKGFLRLYANSSGEIAGYTWSKQDATFHGPNQRPLVVGRIILP